METRAYKDFDAFADHVGDIDAVMMLQNPRSRLWVISHVNLPGVHVQMGKLGSGNIVEGKSCDDGYLVYLPLTAGCTYSASGTTIKPGSLMILEPGCEFCVATKDAHDWCSVFLSTERLAESGSTGGPLRATENTTCRVSPQSHHLAHQFRSLVHNVICSSESGSGFEGTPAARLAVEHAQRIATAIITGQQIDLSNRSGRPGIPRQEIIRHCLGLLEERDGKRVQVGELCSKAGVSERTLRTAFQDYFGIGPVRYLQLRQLHQVHRALRTADPDGESVADVLFQNGVWELSRFARRYREIFGELPSQTLRTTRRR